MTETPGEKTEWSEISWNKDISAKKALFELSFFFDVIIEDILNCLPILKSTDPHLIFTIIPIHGGVRVIVKKMKDGTIQINEEKDILWEHFPDKL